MIERPLVSIIIATYNSENTLDKVLNSIKKQNYPKKRIEILIIDGGSADKTIFIAKKYKCKILVNMKKDQVYAKKLGYIKAKGKYIIFLDSDEVLESIYSINRKVTTMLLDKKMKAVTSSGYRTPSNFPELNSYINKYGDPFSFFMYRSSRNYKFFIKETKSKN